MLPTLGFTLGVPSNTLGGISIVVAILKIDGCILDTKYEESFVTTRATCLEVCK
jgi:hypothetical protein